MTSENFLMIDLPAALAGALSCLSCAILGNFLVLRRQALIGDAISHVVLPGIVIGFLISGELGSLPIFLGALGAALVSVVFIFLIRYAGNLEPGAAMGVVFTLMFASGVVLLEQSGTSGIHLDVEHTLYGNLEGILWIGPASWGDLLDPVHLSNLPLSLVSLAVVSVLVCLSVSVLFKELKVSTFDPGLAASLGFRPRILDAALMLAVAVAAVAAFEAVGSILVIAMFICPAATARMLTDRLSRQIWLSAVFALLSAFGGYGLGAFGPLWLGHTDAVSAAGMIAVVAGFFQVMAMIFAPRYGALSKILAKRKSDRPLDLPVGTFSYRQE